MEYTPEEEERINAIQKHIKGEKPAEIYRSIGRSKRWFNTWLGRYRTGRDGWYKNLPKRAKVIPHKTSERIEQAVVNQPFSKKVDQKHPTFGRIESTDGWY